MQIVYQRSETIVNHVDPLKGSFFLTHTYKSQPYKNGLAGKEWVSRARLTNTVPWGSLTPVDKIYQCACSRVVGNDGHKKCPVASMS